MEPVAMVRLSTSANSAHFHDTLGSGVLAAACVTLRATVTCARKGLRSGRKPAALASRWSAAASAAAGPAPAVLKATQDLRLVPVSEPLELQNQRSSRKCPVGADAVRECGELGGARSPAPGPEKRA